MRITLLTVGKTDVKWVKEGLDLYVSRLVHYIQFSVNEIPELKNVSALSKEQIKEREGALILAGIKPSDDVILLDEHGRQFRSVEFASFLQEKMACSGRNIVFVIGGAYGFSKDVPFGNDFLAPDGPDHICRAAVPGLHDNEGRAVPS